MVLLCLALSLVATVETSATVLSIVEPLHDVPAPSDAVEVESRIYLSIEKQAKHLLAKVHPWTTDPALKLVTESKSDEHWIRPNAGTVLGFAFLHRFGPYDESVIGISKDHLLQDVIVPMMRYLTVVHLTGTRPTGDGKSWGSQWQSAHWAHMLGRGAWWIWDDLPADLQVSIRKLVAHEADRIANTDPPHQVLEDTKSEENAWNSQILSVAVTLMPDDPRRTDWEKAFQRWALSSYLRPADETSQEIVDGRPVLEQFTGANIYDDFTLENHGRVHPDYMGTYPLLMGCVLDYVMSGRQAPQATTHNCAGIYAILKWFSLPSGGFVYPNGQDWELLRDPEWLYTHLLMAAQGDDPDAWSLMRPCLDTQERMQARSPSGTVYLDEEFFFPSTLSDLIYYDAMAWLALHYHGPISDRPAEKKGVLRLDGGRLILNRTPSAICTFSWGAQVMAQVVAYRPDRITSPHPRSGTGHVRLAGKKDDLPLRMHHVEVTHDAQRFDAKLELDHGIGLFRASLEFHSDPDGTWRLKEKLVALRDTETDEVATGLVGILNNPHWVYERGERRITLGNDDHLVRSGEGSVLEAAVNGVDVDGVLHFRGTHPLHVLYRGAKEAERARFTDELYLNYVGGKRPWKAGDVISEFEVTCTVAPNSRNTIEWRYDKDDATVVISLKRLEDE